MSDRKPANPSPTYPLPERPNLEHLKKEAKQRLKAMRLSDPGATLAAAQFATARQYGFTSWRRLVAHVAVLRNKGKQLPEPSENSPQALSAELKAEADPAEIKAPPIHDEGAQKAAHEKFSKFQRRTGSMLARGTRKSPPQKTALLSHP